MRLLISAETRVRNKTKANIEYTNIKLHTLLMNLYLKNNLSRIYVRYSCTDTNQLNNHIKFRTCANIRLHIFYMAIFSSLIQQFI